MSQQRYHCERAFCATLVSRGVPFVSVNEARRTLVPGACAGKSSEGCSLKSFDLVVYRASHGQSNLLIDIKGRRGPLFRSGTGRTGRPAPQTRLENWVTTQDVHDLQSWQGLFGPGFEPAFAFVYWWPAGDARTSPADGLYDHVIQVQGHWYGTAVITLASYLPVCQVRSSRWGTMDVPPALFGRLPRVQLVPTRALPAAG